jgi:3-methylfumaryl-CoA hydratase
MRDVEITPDEIEDYRRHVGRTIEHTDVIEEGIALRLAATLGVERPRHELPPMWHHGLFLSPVATSALGIDGHPRRGDFLPPVRLPRRMHAGATLKFLRPLAIGARVTRLSRILSVDHRRGQTGDLVFVRVEMSLSQNDAVCIEEQQTIVYRGPGKTAAVISRPRLPLESGERSENWLPTTTELFRYSASTFNSHRIHYDRAYATEVEGYPELVVHGPLVATRLCNFATGLLERPLAKFGFRGEAPAFVGQDIRISGMKTTDGCVVKAERADGVTAMSATATCVPL